MPSTGVEDRTSPESPLPPPPPSLMDADSSIDTTDLPIEFPEVPQSVLTFREAPPFATESFSTNGINATFEQASVNENAQQGSIAQNNDGRDESATVVAVHMKDDCIYDAMRATPAPLKPPEHFEDSGQSSLGTTSPSNNGSTDNYNQPATKDEVDNQTYASEIYRSNSDHIYCELPPRRQLRPIPKVTKHSWTMIIIDIHSTNNDGRPMSSL